MNDENIPKLKDFQFERRLGSGTYATVYKAYNKYNKDEVFAIKCIKRSSLNEISTENLLREIEILKNIRHEYIVQLKDFQWNENFIYLIMEYCPGGDLSNFIKTRHTIPERYVKRFLQQIACALKHLYSLGIAHMDLKPQNILLTSTNNPSLKIADFGFAQKLMGTNGGRSLRGSPLYMAPEILKCKIYGPKVDLWSVGVILFEVIFGYAPFVSTSFEELEKKILDDKPIEIPSTVMLSETCKDLLKRLLNRDPEYRISFEQFFNHPFIDLDHMPSSTSLPQAKFLLEKAIEADTIKDYEFAQKCYLNALQYLIPAIQYEKDYQKKRDLRERSNTYLRRAEELATMSNRSDSTSNFYTVRSYKNLARPETSSATSLSTISSIQPTDSNVPTDPISKACATNERFKYAIQLCRSCEKTSSYEDFESILSNYQTGIAILLEFLKTEPKDSELSKVLKKQIDKWLGNAERVKERAIETQLNEMQISQPDSRMDDDSSSLGGRSCVLQ